MSKTIPVPHRGGPLNGTHNRELLETGVPSTCHYYAYIDADSNGNISTRWGSYLKTNHPERGWEFLWMQGEGEAPDVEATFK